VLPIDLKPSDPHVHQGHFDILAEIPGGVRLTRWRTVVKSLFRIFAMATFAASFPAIAFDLQGHRGARGLAPENTIAAFSTALSIGVTTLELESA